MTPLAPRAIGVAAAAALMLQGCPSAYQRTFEEKTQQLEAAERAQQQREAAARAQAQKYAAVVYFPVGSAAIDDDGQRELRWFVQQMQPYPHATLNVQGFTDSTGSEAKNQSLGDERAANVARYLSSQGIEPSRIVTIGFGQTNAAGTNQTAQGRRNNRRVEVTVR